MRMATAAWAMLGMAGALAGCAHHRVPRGGETISYATAMCFGTCPVYTVTVGPDGQGVFNGEKFTAVAGERRFQATPEQVRAFTAALAKVRTEGDREITPGKPGCTDFATDMPGATVRWQGAGGVSSLTFNYGCARDNRQIADALRAAPGLLPIGDLVGKR
ncbi:hypothetical protein SAMN05192583_0345 [Sphingomonas gellani]|uniref:DUF6438 domain-containing protein n=1 Tax=Sphingomonas gellani TaxID=1166340 RepID=A0A1H7YNK1_9SPHN|nr:DUF6438 domain-containing protein [Sphingomonas gellani]SEM47816.1 hypothetical protein SAMN05192583_0345 [Sphingomonas gellani]